jgi:hypothetical protein
MKEFFFGDDKGSKMTLEFNSIFKFKISLLAAYPKIKSLVHKCEKEASKKEME